MRGAQAVRRATGLLAALTITLTITLSAPGTAPATSLVRLNVTFTPERLGQETTIGFGFRIATPAGRVPPPLTGVEISYPAGLGFALSELGIATCTAGTLEAHGPQGCPPNSLMGYGTALAEIPIGPEILHETAQVTIVKTTVREGQTALLVFAESESPVNAQLVFPGLMLPATGPFAGRLALEIPLVPSLPEAPYVAVVQFHSTIGPLHLHYQEHIHGHTIVFKPKGIPLPATCPHRGFRFAATFNFLNAATQHADATVPCPRNHDHRR